jgi:hypothetical protein
MSDGRLRLKCDGTRAETTFCFWAKRTRNRRGASVHSTTGSRGVRNSGSNAGYTMFRVSVKGTDYPLHSPVSPSLPLPCVTVCNHISPGLYCMFRPSKVICSYLNSYSIEIVIITQNIDQFSGFCVNAGT